MCVCVKMSVVKKTIESKHKHTRTHRIHAHAWCASKNGRRRFLHKINARLFKNTYACVNVFACTGVYWCMSSDRTRALLFVYSMCVAVSFDVPTHPAASHNERTNEPTTIPTTSTKTTASMAATEAEAALCAIVGVFLVRAIKHFHRCNICVSVMVHEFGMASNWNENGFCSVSFTLNRDALVFHSGYHHQHRVAIHISFYCCLRLCPSLGAFSKRHPATHSIGPC